MRHSEAVTGPRLTRVIEDIKVIMAEQNSSEEEKITRIVAVIQAAWEDRTTQLPEWWHAWVLDMVRLAVPDETFQAKIYAALGEPDLNFGPPSFPLSGTPDKT